MINMEINTPSKINPQYEINKTQIQTLLEPTTTKPDDKNGTRIYPYLSVDLCDNLIYQNVLLKTCIEVLAEDTIFNDISVTNNNNTNENTSEKIKQFWENNQDELGNQVIDWFSYGFGASEIVYDKNKEPARLYQIPADTLYISKETKQKTKDNPTGISYYAVQTVAGQKDIKMKLSHLEYGPEDDDLPTCLWLGGGRKSSFFDYPMWISCFNHVSASVSLDMLDAKKISDGNLISGILTIIRPPGLDGGDEVDSLEERMEEKGNGLFTLELTTLNPNIPLTVDYIQISESNYDYLIQLADKSDGKILATFKIPKARLLIDDTTESMNSNKTNTLYEIYTRELSNRQRPLENKMNQFNSKYFEYDGKVDIETPVFIDRKEVEADITMRLFDAGLITFGQAINKISKTFPEFNDVEIDENNPIYNERYFHGQPFGMIEDTPEESEFYNIGDFIETAKINEVFSRESQD